MPRASSEPTSLHAFSIHFIRNLLYLVPFGEFAAPEPTRSKPQQHRLHQHADDEQRNPLLRVSADVLPDDGPIFGCPWILRFSVDPFRRRLTRLDRIGRVNLDGRTRFAADSQLEGLQTKLRLAARHSHSRPADQFDVSGAYGCAALLDSEVILTRKSCKRAIRKREAVLRKLRLLGRAGVMLVA
jgi:hypothetical protein